MKKETAREGDDSETGTVTHKSARRRRRPRRRNIDGSLAKVKLRSSIGSRCSCLLRCFRRSSPGRFPPVTGLATAPGMATLRMPDVVPSPSDDCERLRKAFQGWGTDEKAIIWTLGHRNASQRRLIRETYQQLYNQSLIDSLHSELSGDFRKAVIFWTYDPPERDARLAKEALQTKRKGINHLLPIVEIACATSPHHLIAVRQAYCSLYDCSLEEDISSAISLPFRKILVGLVSSFRYDKEVVNMDVANSEAALLHEAMESRQLDQDSVLWILGTRNIFQLRATFQCYEQNYGSPIDQDMKSCGKGDLESLLRVVVCCLDCPERHFAEVSRVIHCQSSGLVVVFPTHIKENIIRFYETWRHDSVRSGNDNKRHHPLASSRFTFPSVLNMSAVLKFLETSKATTSYILCKTIVLPISGN